MKRDIKDSLSILVPLKTKQNMQLNISILYHIIFNLKLLSCHPSLCPSMSVL